MTTPAANPSARLRDLAAIALLGSDRAGSKSAEEITVECARVGTMSRAGFQSLTAVTSLPVCPPESLPAVSLAAASTLNTLLAGDNSALLEEWIALATASGRRVGHAALPALLDWCVPSRPRTR